jgi:hypothetical protein
VLISRLPAAATAGRRTRIGRWREVHLLVVGDELRLGLPGLPPAATSPPPPPSPKIKPVPPHQDDVSRSARPTRDLEHVGKEKEKGEG